MNTCIGRNQRGKLKEFEDRNAALGTVRCRAKLLRDKKLILWNSLAKAMGRSPRSFMVLIQRVLPRFEITNYSEHSLGAGEEASAIAYIQIKHSDGRTRWGAGVDTNIELASIRAVLSALNRS